MLFTRLSAENRTVLVEKTDTLTAPVSTGDAISMGRDRHVDYVLMGSITMLGTMISTDAQVLSISEAGPVLTFNEAGQDQGDIIAHLDHLTGRINESLFNVAKAIETPPAAAQDTGEVYTHPEKMLIPGIEPKIPPLPAPSAPRYRYSTAAKQR